MLGLDLPAVYPSHLQDGLPQNHPQLSYTSLARAGPLFAGFLPLPLPLSGVMIIYPTQGSLPASPKW